MKKALLTVGIGLALFVSPLVVLADTISGNGTGGTVSGNTSITQTSGQVVNPLGVTSICGLIKALLGAAVAIGIPIAVLFIVWAGLKFVLARGNAEELSQARQNFLYTVIGIAIFLGAWLLSMVIVNTVNSLATGSGQQVVSSCN